MINIEQIPKIDFCDNKTVRLVASAYIDEPALLPLCDDENELEILEILEMQTSPRHNQLIAIPAGISAEELLNEKDGFGWSYVNAAFCYTRSTGNRFNSNERGAWYASYGSKAVKTSQAEISYHLTRELDNVGIYENITNYREIWAGFVTVFFDLWGYEEQDFLDKNIKIAYPAGQLLAGKILKMGANGVIYPSRRFKGGKCLAAFRPNLVQNIRLGAIWQFNWDKKPDPKITKFLG